jgi:tRNA threonylcarbamoyl adenosine modification protein YeaZ
MLILAFDTATDVATSALVGDGEVLGERMSRAVTLLEDVDALLRQAGTHTRDLVALAVGIGPGSFTGVRIGLSTARGLALALDIPVAGVSTLAALAAGAPGAVPVIDARRREVFVPGRVLSPEDLEVEPGRRYVGSGAVRYRDVLASTSAIYLEPASMPSWPGISARRSRSSRCTSACPTLIKGACEHHGEPGGLPPSGASRPQCDRKDRTGLVSHTVVALDVRG